jgi:hypothetical protein
MTGTLFGAGKYGAGSAEISADGAYRYRLTREWAVGPVMAWIGLNPSDADADADDPTIRRMCGFARRERCGAIWVFNTHGLRSPDPAALRRHLDPIGPDNDAWLARCRDADIVVAAWGAHLFAAARATAIRELLADVPLMCLGVTASGAPRHPLYVRADAPLVPWTGRAGIVRAYECGTTKPAAPREAAGELSQVSGGGSGI